MTAARFRFLIVLQAVLMLLLPASVFFLDGPSASMGEAPPLLFAGLPGWLALLLALGMAAIVVAGMVGTYRFKRWGRTLYLLMAAFHVLLPLLDYLWKGAVAPEIGPGIVGTLTTAMPMIDGAILALAYCSPVSAHFHAGAR